MWSKLKNYLIDVRYELKKVVMPEKKNLWGSTIVVIVVSLLLGFAIGLFDYLITRGLTLIPR